MTRPKSVGDLAGWRLSVDARCCTAVVSFTGGNHADVQHSRRCAEPDHHAVAQIVAGAIADIVGEPIAVQHSNRAPRRAITHLSMN